MCVSEVPLEYLTIFHCDWQLQCSPLQQLPVWWFNSNLRISPFKQHSKNHVQAVPIHPQWLKHLEFSLRKTLSGNDHDPLWPCWVLSVKLKQQSKNESKQRRKKERKKERLTSHFEMLHSQSLIERYAVKRQQAFDTEKKQSMHRGPNIMPQTRKSTKILCFPLFALTQALESCSLRHCSYNLFMNLVPQFLTWISRGVLVSNL